MTDAIATVGAAMRAELQQLEAISRNFSHMATPAYKSARMVGGGFDAVLGTRAPAGMVLDHSAGPYNATQRSLDFALEHANDYFQVLTDAGVRMTRRGDFRLDALGRLVTHGGHAVLGVGGEIRLETEDVVVDAQGRFRIGDREVARFDVLRLAAGARPQPDGAGLFIPSAEAQPVPAPELSVRQGYLEGANVDAGREMLEMMALTRRFELAQEAIRARDEMLGLAIGTLGDTSRR